jgi:hypothetical protein
MTLIYNDTSNLRLGIDLQQLRDIHVNPANYISIRRFRDVHGVASMLLNQIETTSNLVRRCAITRLPAQPANGRSIADAGQSDGDRIASLRSVVQLLSFHQFEV